MDTEQTMYEGGRYDELEINVDKWSYFELAGILKKLGYIEVDTIYYKDPTLEMNVLNYDKGGLDIVDLCMMYLCVDAYIQRPLS